MKEWYIMEASWFDLYSFSEWKKAIRRGEEGAERERERENVDCVMI